jgi:hypothetical protein
MKWCGVLGHVYALPRVDVCPPAPTAKHVHGAACASCPS